MVLSYKPLHLDAQQRLQEEGCVVDIKADNGEFRFPPATHFIATVEDFIDMPTSSSEDIDGIDDDADKEQGQDPPVIRRETAPPSHDVYMIDTLKKPCSKGQGRSS